MRNHRRRLAAVLFVGVVCGALAVLLARSAGTTSAQKATRAQAVAAHAALRERERGEADGGAEAEAYTDRAFPASEITIDQIHGAIAANDAVNGRGSKLSSKWDALGPETLDVDRSAPSRSSSRRSGRAA
jgi:hypothetical protein